MLNVTSRIARKVRAKPTPTTTPWSGGRALFGTILSFYGAQEVASLIIGLYIGARGWNDAQVTEWISGVPAQFGYTVIVEAFTVAIIWLLVRKYAWEKIKVGLGLLKPRWRDLGYMAVAFVVYYALYMALLSVTNVLMPIDTDQKQDIGFETASSFIPLALTFVSLVILPPLVEELVFRGFLFGGLRRVFSPIITALIVSILFALPHSWQSTDGSTLWNAAIDTFALSLVLCYLREKTGALWAGIGLHALKNLVAFLAIFIFHVQ
jgi:membrane protease YdiL (CAAX protease family)